MTLEQVPLLRLQPEMAQIEQPSAAALKEIVSSAGFIGGESVDSFEKARATYCGTRRAIGVVDAALLAVAGP